MKLGIIVGEKWTCLLCGCYGHDMGTDDCQKMLTEHLMFSHDRHPLLMSTETRPNTLAGQKRVDVTGPRWPKVL